MSFNFHNIYMHVKSLCASGCLCSFCFCLCRRRKEAPCMKLRCLGKLMLCRNFSVQVGAAQAHFNS